MAWPRHVMQSVAIPAVTHTRASGDYQPSNSQWNIGDSSILTHSIGLAPFKDVSPKMEMKIMKSLCTASAGVW